MYLFIATIRVRTTILDNKGQLLLPVVLAVVGVHILDG